MVATMPTQGQHCGCGSAVRVLPVRIEHEHTCGEKFGNMRDLLLPSLGPEIIGVLTQLYRELSGYVHAQLSGTNGVLRGEGTGPAWESTAFDRVYRAFRDVLGMCLVILSVGWSGYSIQTKLLPVF